jgi:peptide/nickel transport system substrate-binding protein
MTHTFGRRGVLGMATALGAGTLLGGFPQLVLAADEGAPIEEIRWALPSVTDNLFIPHAWTTYIGAIMSLVQEGMLSFGEDLGLAPATAVSWEQADPVTLKYHLRNGVTFHDGSKLTTDDVVATMLWNMKPASGSQLAAFYSAVSSVEATGPSEITVKLKTPNVQFQYTPAHMAGFIFQKAQLDAHAQDIGTPAVLPLGTGPYKLVEFAPGDHVVLEAYDGYWGTKPVAKRITFVSIPDRQSRLLAMRSGDIDGTFDLAISDIPQWKSARHVSIVTTPSLGVIVLTLDQSTAPFDDVHVRRAIAYSVDRAGLVNALLKGNGEPAVALDPPEIWGRVLPADEVRSFYATLPGYGFDLAKARDELKQSKHAGGFKIAVPASNADPYMVNILQSLAGNLAQIGITLDVQEVDNSQWLAQYFAHEKLGMQVMPYYPDFADPVNYPFLFLSSSNAVKDGMNGSNFKNPEMDKLIDEANQPSDIKARAEALKKIFKLAADEVAVVPIFWPYAAMAINSKYKLKGYSAFWYNTPWAIRGFGRA